MSSPSHRLSLASALVAVSLLFSAWVMAGPPVVSNVRATQRPGTGLVDVLYDLQDPEGDKVAITVHVSFDSGNTYKDTVRTVSGLGSGKQVAPGRDRQLVWDAGADLDPIAFRNVRLRIIADDGYANAPAQMAYIPASTVLITGGTVGYPVYIGGFAMDKYEVTKALWDEVAVWGVAHGYGFNSPGYGLALDHPVMGVSWHDAVKWANARSEMRGRNPVYFTDTAKTKVYRTGIVDLMVEMVKWDGNGYRLPTAAEWEKAARGGGRYSDNYPWFGDIDPTKANYGYVVGHTTRVGYYNGVNNTGGTDMANGYGLYDMAGNVWEWCWDWHDPDWYSTPSASTKDSGGPVNGSYRVFRGGSWDADAMNCRVGVRNWDTPSNTYLYLGFRLVVGLP